MQFNIKSTNMELAENLKEYVRKKMDMLDKYFGRIKVTSARFEVCKTTNRHKKGEIYRAEANLIADGDLLRVEKTEKDIFKAVDKVKDHLELVIKKHKERKMGRKKVELD